MNEIAMPQASDRATHSFFRRWSSRFAIAAMVAILVKAVMLFFVWALSILGVEIEMSRQIFATDSFGLNIAWAVILGPLLETLLMGWFILLMLDLGWHRAVVVSASAMIWALLHQWTAPPGWVAFFPFLVLSYLFIERNRTHADGFTVATLTHCFLNAIAVTVSLAMNAPA